MANQYTTGRATPIGCGTDAGYNRHRIRKEQTCAPCRAAHVAYSERKRQEAVKRNRAIVQARLDALEALAHRHPEEFQALRARALRDLSS